MVIITPFTCAISEKMYSLKLFFNKFKAITFVPIVREGINGNLSTNCKMKAKLIRRKLSIQSLDKCFPYTFFLIICSKIITISLAYLEKSKEKFLQSQSLRLSPFFRLQYTLALPGFSGSEGGSVAIFIMKKPIIMCLIKGYTRLLNFRKCSILPTVFYVINRKKKSTLPAVFHVISKINLPTLPVY